MQSKTHVSGSLYKRKQKETDEIEKRSNTEYVKIEEEKEAFKERTKITIKPRKG